MSQNPPKGYHTITPYIVSTDPEALIGFVEKALGGSVVSRFDREDGTVMHAEMKVGDSMLMLSGVTEDFTPFPLMAHLYVEDVDVVHGRALANRATSIREPEDQFYGDRTSGVTDAQGNSWWLATRVEDVSAEEMARRAAVNT